MVEEVVAELVKLLRHPPKDDPAALTPLQKVFVRLFR
jgi:streptomycin 6-kinase